MALDLTAKLVAAQARKAKAEASISDDDRAEIAARDELARLDGESREAERTARDLDLSRRLDAARELLGDGVALIAVSPKEFDDTFIVRRDGKAHAKWNKALAEIASGNRKIDQAEEARKYAVACVFDWNGIIDSSSSPLTSP